MAEQNNQATNNNQVINNNQATNKQEEKAKPQKIYLKDYKAPSFDVEYLNLFFDLHEDYTRVQSEMTLIKKEGQAPLVLDGVGLDLEWVKINGKPLLLSEYKKESERLIIDEALKNLADRFLLEISVRIKPQENTALEGLYKSSGVFCTQCEAESFRKITYFFDRPDVMTKYKVTIQADETLYPVLLSNGDKIESKKVENGRHQVVWVDPFKKPSYLFALVGGNLGVLRDEYTTLTGKKVNLEIYSPHGFQSRCEHAMLSLKKSMLWDEERFGREYDLQTYMILAVDDFNMGAMENKGLNVFNSRLVYANPQTATDDDYTNIESVIAHEYFHNWTGNRITCRDWFHLSLKEGLTVFRDQEFSGDMSSRAMVRIDNVNDLRSHQFPEDAGPNAHPIRPESCLAVDNFYTATIYEKGSEVIRMMQTMVGRPGFRKGMDLYFERHDGQAVIIEDFAKAISDANQQDWEQFKRWYSQAGTPRVKVLGIYNKEEKSYSLELHQSCLPTPGQNEKKPFHIPLAFGLMDSITGKDLPISHPEIVVNTEGQSLLHLKLPTQKWLFNNIENRPILSLNRQFSAPIYIENKVSDDDLVFIMNKDTDSFNRWEASQNLYQNELSKLILSLRKNDQAQSSQAKTQSQAQSQDAVENLKANASLLEAFGNVLESENLDCDLKAKLITLPDDKYLVQLEKTLDANAFLKARLFLETSLARANEKTLLKIYEKYHGKNLNSREPKDFSERRLKNTALYFLSLLPDYDGLVYDQFKKATHMTDQKAALVILCSLKSKWREKGLQEFYDKWKNENLVLNMWYQAQANSIHPDVFDSVKRHWLNPDFNRKNPNRVYALLRAFGQNIVKFHEPREEIYPFYSDCIAEIDKFNPQVATRLASAFDVWTKLPSPQKEKAQMQLEKLLKVGLSKNTYEIISRAVATTL